MQNSLISKDKYLETLSDTFNDSLVDILGKNIEQRMRFTPVKSTEKGFYADFILPRRLYDVVICSLSAQGSNRIDILFQKFVENTKTLTFKVSQYKVVKRGALFQLEREKLTKNVITGIVDTLSHCENISRGKGFSTDNYRKSVRSNSDQKLLVLCCVNDNSSAARTLSLLSTYLFVEPHANLVFISKDPKLRTEQFLQNSKFSDSLDFHDAEKLQGISETLSEVISENQVQFKSEICSDNFYVESFQKVSNSKITLSEGVVGCLTQLENYFGNFETKFQVVALCCHSEDFFMRQVLHLFLTYLHFKSRPNKTKCCVCEMIRTHLNVQFLSHGPIVCNEPCTLKALERRYFENVNKSFLSKYGDTSEWKPFVPVISKSVLTLDTLSCSVTSSVTLLDFSSAESKFLMYNYSRLATLLNNYENQVLAGNYPKLSGITEIDFSILTELEEIQIVDFLWRFEDILVNYFSCFDESNFNPSMFKPHLIIAYLRQFCKLLSSFYSRYHILGHNLPHLMPVMFARIYLVKAAKLVISRLFDILGVQPLEQM